jgi:SPOR domain
MSNITFGIFCFAMGILLVVFIARALPFGNGMIHHQAPQYDPVYRGYASKDGSFDLSWVVWAIFAGILFFFLKAENKTLLLHDNYLYTHNENDADGLWGIQISPFGSEISARSECDKLHLKKLSNCIAKKNGYFSACVGPYKSKNDALIIKSKYNFSGAIISLHKSK